MCPLATARVVAHRALDESYGQDEVDWAVEMLSAGFDGEHLAMLASEGPPFRFFELRPIVDRALTEVGIEPVELEMALRRFAAERFRPALGDDEALFAALRDVLAYHRPGTSALEEVHVLHELWIALRDENDHLPWNWPNTRQRWFQHDLRELAAAIVAEADLDDL